MALTDKAKELQERLLETLGETPGDLYQNGDPSGSPEAIISLASKPAATVAAPGAAAAPGALLSAPAGVAAPLHFDDRSTELNEGARFMNALAVLLVNSADINRDLKSFSDILDTIGRLTAAIDKKVATYLNSSTTTTTSRRWRPRGAGSTTSRRA